MAARWFESQANVSGAAPIVQVDTSVPVIPIANTSTMTTSTVPADASSCEIRQNGSSWDQICDSRPFAAITAGLIVAAVLFWWCPPLVRSAEHSTYEAANEYISEVSVKKVLIWSLVAGVLVYLVVPLVWRRS